MWIVRDGKLAYRDVTVGVAGDSLTEVKSGLAEEDLVVVRPGAGLREGRTAIARAQARN